MQRRILISALAGLTAIGGAAFLPASPASGGAMTTIVVDTTDDDGLLDACTGAAGDCSLRGALEGFVTDNHTDGVTITVQVPAGDYALTDQIFLYQANVVVQGAGADETVVSIDRSGDDSLIRHLELSVDGELDVTLTDMTFTGGNADQNEAAGGSILSRGGAELTLQRMHLIDNEVRGNGGAIAAYGSILRETLVIEDSTLAGNSASETGGAVHVSAGETAVITNSTFTDNSAAFGGALYVGQFDEEVAAEATLLHVTMADNGSSGFQGDAATAGGAIGVSDGAEVTITSSVIERSVEAEPVLQPAAVGDPAANCNIAAGGTLTSGGNNVVDDDTCNATETTDQPDTAANTQSLADNGGPTFTMALLAASPAVDAAGVTCDVPDDQRGVARPQDGNNDGTNGCDSGAFELPAIPEAPPAVPQGGVAPSFTG